MGVLSKEAYEGKREWAARRMVKNAENESLTEEQHEVLAWLCSFRHEWHMHAERLWSSENQDLFEEYEQINKKLSEVGLDIVEGLPRAEDFPDENWYFYDYKDSGEYADLEDWMENGEEYDRFHEMHNEVNNAIERYLSEIDKKYGTEYCPSGYTRLH